jgi:hypothetical protein
MKELKHYDVTLPNLSIYKSGIKSLGPHRIRAYSEEQALAGVLSNSGNRLGANYRWLYEKLRPEIKKYVKEVEMDIYDIETAEELKQMELFPKEKGQGGCGCMFSGGD